MIAIKLSEKSPRFVVADEKIIGNNKIEKTGLQVVYNWKVYDLYKGNNNKLKSALEALEKMPISMHLI